MINVKIKLTLFYFAVFYLPKPATNQAGKNMLIEIKNKNDSSVIFSHVCVNNSIGLTVADLRDANLRYADLRSAKLRSADLSDADLRYANLIDANLRSADLRSANLRSADLRSANLRSADLRSANLRDANLIDADLRYANLSYADLRSADLSDADLSDANLSDADLRDANLRDANLRSVVGDMKIIFSMNLDYWPISFTKEVLQIGCQSHNHNEWFEFDNERISKMDDKALAWWLKWKEFIFKAMELALDK